jgi:hypothetical protein
MRRTGIAYQVSSQDCETPMVHLHGCGYRDENCLTNGCLADVISYTQFSGGAQPSQPRAYLAQWLAVQPSQHKRQHRG